MRSPSVEGIITSQALEETGATIAELQLRNGMIEWFPGGHADPWNHVESAMALSTIGMVAEAEAAYQWLVDQPRPDGSWHNYYVAGGVQDPKIDNNCVVYVATGVWHHYLATKDQGFAACLFPLVDRAIESVLDMQTRRGEVLWARMPDGRPWNYALLTGSSSIGHSLACAVDLAEMLGLERPHWGHARDRGDSRRLATADGP